VPAKLPATAYRTKAIECRGLAAIAPQRLKSKFLRLAKIYESLADETARKRSHSPSGKRRKKQ
jgi:hypothetical protein